MAFLGELDEVRTGCIFPWGIVAATTFVGGRDGVGGVRTRARCNPELPLCSMAVTVLSGVGAGPKGLEQHP